MDQAVRHSSVVPLPAALPGERRDLAGRAGRLSCYVDGGGPPLLLVHSVNAAPSAYEVKPVFEQMRAERRVYALELPGFGCSERAPREYRLGDFVDAVHDALAFIAAEHGAGVPVDTLGMSLAGEFLARAAVEEPGRFRSLALVNPTGFTRSSGRLRGPAGSTREISGLYRALTWSAWRDRIFELLTREGSIRFFLRGTFGSKEVDPGMVQYAWLSARQPYAAYAPFAFISGRLFARDIRDLYERLQAPVWLAHGTRGDFRDFSGADWVRQSPNWRVTVFDTGALPHFQAPAEFLAAYRSFLAAPPGP